MKPWVAIDLLTNKQIGRFETEKAAAMHCVTNKIDAVDISYRPRKRRTARTFP